MKIEKFHKLLYSSKYIIRCYYKSINDCSGDELIVKMYCAKNKIHASVISPGKAREKNENDLPENSQHILHINAPETAVGEVKDMMFSCSEEYV